MIIDPLPGIPPEALLESIPSVLLVFDREGRLTARNGAAARALGLAVLPAGLDPLGSELGGAVRTCIAREQPVRVEQVTVPVAGGDRLFGFSLSPIGAGRAVLGVLATGRDITARVEVQREVDAIERRGDLAQVARQVAHELRNPLNAIRVHAQYTALAFGEDHPGRSYAQAIVTEVDRMDRILQGLRDLSQAHRLELCVTSPGPALLRAAQLLAPLLGEMAVALEVAVPLDLPPLCHDPHRLVQVVMNLVKNGAEATGSGGTVTLRASGGPGLVLEVEDDGPGVDPALGESAFDLFISTKGSRGEGIGLCVCREIVEQHGGTISYGTTVEGRTSFRVELPNP